MECINTKDGFGNPIAHIWKPCCSHRVMVVLLKSITPIKYFQKYLLHFWEANLTNLYTVSGFICHTLCTIVCYSMKTSRSGNPVHHIWQPSYHGWFTVVLLESMKHKINHVWKAWTPFNEAKLFKLFIFACCSMKKKHICQLCRTNMATLLLR